MKYGIGEIIRKINKLILDCFYIGLVSISIFVFLELGTRLLLQERKDTVSDILSSREKMLAYSYFEWKDQYFEDINKADLGILYEPYSLWKTTDARTDLVNVLDGCRRTWTPEKSTKEETLVFMLGGSTTLCSEAPDDLTISSELAKLLHSSQRQNRYIVVNYGVSGFVNDNEVHLLVDLLRSGKRPDIVIFLDGANEISNKVLRGIPHYRYDTYQSIGKRYSIRVFIGKIASKFAFIRLFKKVNIEISK